MQDPPKGFVDHPYPYHHELELVIERGQLRYGIARQDGWVIQVPFTMSGERIEARIFRNHKNYSDADCMEVLTPSADRVEAECELFGVAAAANTKAFDTRSNSSGNANRSKTALAESVAWKWKLSLSNRLPGSMDIGPSSHTLRKGQGHRKKRKVGFLRHGSRKVLIDAPQCPIATDAINDALPAARDDIYLLKDKEKGGTILYADTPEGVLTDPKKLPANGLADWFSIQSR